MRYKLSISRRASKNEPVWMQNIIFETENEKETVLSALLKINEGGFTDESGKPVSPIRFECSCLQKKCGACAMVINGRPQLACDFHLRDVAKKDGTILIEPLKKFPPVADLIVDRSILFDNLKTMNLWAEEAADLNEKKTDRAYDASLCLQCGCCLEVCPGFYPGGDFFSTAGFVPTARLLNALSKDEQARIKKEYQSHIYKGCAKSLACRNVCPAKIDVDRLMSRSNAMAVWKRK